MRFSSFSMFCLFLRYLQKDWSLVLKLIFVSLSLLEIFVGKLKNEKKKKFVWYSASSEDERSRIPALGRPRMYYNDSFQMKTGFKKCCNYQAQKYELPWHHGFQYALVLGYEDCRVEQRQRWSWASHFFVREGEGYLVFNILTLKEGSQKEQKPGH